MIRGVTITNPNPITGIEVQTLIDQAVQAYIDAHPDNGSGGDIQTIVATYLQNHPTEFQTIVSDYLEAYPSTAVQIISNYLGNGHAADANTIINNYFNGDQGQALIIILDYFVSHPSFMDDVINTYMYDNPTSFKHYVDTYIANHPDQFSTGGLTYYSRIFNSTDKIIKLQYQNSSKTHMEFDLAPDECHVIPNGTILSSANTVNFSYSGSLISVRCAYTIEGNTNGSAVYQIGTGSLNNMNLGINVNANMDFIILDVPVPPEVPEPVLRFFVYNTTDTAITLDYMSEQLQPVSVTVPPFRSFVDLRVNAAPYVDISSTGFKRKVNASYVSDNAPNGVSPTSVLFTTEHYVGEESDGTAISPFEVNLGLPYSYFITISDVPLDRGSLDIFSNASQPVTLKKIGFDGTQIGADIVIPAGFTNASYQAFKGSDLLAENVHLIRMSTPDVIPADLLCNKYNIYSNTEVQTYDFIGNTYDFIYYPDLRCQWQILARNVNP